MRVFLKKAHLAGLIGATLLFHVWKWLGSFFVGRADRDRRAAERLADLEEEDEERERLDRLRNPGDYRGR